MAFLLFSGAAQAKECFEHAVDPGMANPPPTWTMTVNDDWTMTWYQGAKKIELVTGSVGTGVPQRYARDSAGNSYTYLFHKGDLIFDMSIYTPVSCG